MKKIITEVAYLQMCQECGKHGQVVYSDGEVSPLIMSEQEGLSVVEEALKSGKISLEEAYALDDQIRLSPLPTMPIRIAIITSVSQLFDEQTTTPRGCELN